jgi:hypothetical protein
MREEGTDGRLDGPGGLLGRLRASPLHLFGGGTDLRVQIGQVRLHGFVGERADLLAPAHVRQPSIQTPLELLDRLVQTAAEVGKLLPKLLTLVVRITPGRLDLVQRRLEPLLDAIRKGRHP